MNTPKRNFSREELIGKRKTFVTVLIILQALMIAFFVYFGYTIYSDNWNDTHSLGIVGLLIVSVASVLIARNLGAINKEIKKT